MADVTVIHKRTGKKTVIPTWKMFRLLRFYGATAHDEVGVCMFLDIDGHADFRHWRFEREKRWAV